MNLYLILNLAIIVFPLLRSFEPKIAFYRKFPELLFAIVSVGIPFLVWDSIAARRGDWGFSPVYCSPVTIASLPPGEWLFFVTVPFSSLFLYEVIRYYFLPGRVRCHVATLLVPAGLLLAAAIMFSGKPYTVTVSLAVALILAAFALPGHKLAEERHTWIFLFLSFLPFFVVNSILTALPVVWYSPRAILGFRLGTIPVEDMLYSFSMLSGWLLAYRFWQGRRSRRKEAKRQENIFGRKVENL